MTADQARTLGYTREVLAEGGCHSLELLIQEDADFDGTFRAYDLNEGEMLTINGWNFEFEELGEEA
ncbi:hypothetical protein [Novosphingobium sp.]|uniref:hypothetical protein n=1 Tax=Novosphingobium sp. TaxID=1874826 RepID=UPI0031E34F31